MEQHKTELWFTEKQTPSVAISCRVRRTLCSEQTDFQDLTVLETEQFGRMLVLDGAIQTTEADEFVYHEMIVHVPLVTHPRPEKVLIIGGGDGGAVREALKHESVDKVVLAEIDEAVVRASREYLPTISCALDDARVRVLNIDGIEHVQKHPQTYDVILVDSTDPVGPAVGLFAEEFYRAVYQALKPSGILVAQTESPFYHKDLIRHVYRRVAGVFPLTRLYMASVPTYPGGLWTFTLGSKGPDPLQVEPERRERLAGQTTYYNSDVHLGCFKLPTFVAELLEGQEED